MRHAPVGRLTWRSASSLPDGPTSSRYHPVPLASLAPDVDDDWASAPLSASLWFHVQLGDDLRVNRPLRIEETLEIEGILKAPGSPLVDASVQQARREAAAGLQRTHVLSLIL